MENQIRALRKERGISQEDLARRCGVSRQTINAIENNMTQPYPWPSAWPGSWRRRWTGCSSRPSDGKKTFRHAQQSGSPGGAALLLVSGSESWEWDYIRSRRSTGVRDRSQAAGRESSRVAGN